ncbi:MAG: peroxiredoxin [Novosphingobium sp.]|nr:peroxiredoxin [Novosphingobium sp.]MCP5402700.1 peroxiredoxin [Novosphingobium sp.]
MKKPLFAIAALLALALPSGLRAELPVGTKAPIFATSGALAGNVFRFNLKDALRKGPVVLYFYPKAFTQGCTLETRAFAEAHDKFEAAGATVVGMSADDLPTLQRFSTEECRNKFAVAIASPAVIRAYDVALKREGLPGGLSDRTSYVIAPDGKIAFVHSDLDYRDHVSLTLAAVQKVREAAR